MKFSKNGDFHVVTRITGPHHHYLGLVFRTDRGATLADVEDLSPSPGNGRADLARVEQLQSEVSRGVALANERLGTSYQVSKIRFCGTDPPVSDVYGILAENLVEHVAQSQDNDRGRSEISGFVYPVHSESE